LENAISLDNLLANDNWQTHLIPPQAALADWPIINLDAASLEPIIHGRSIPGAEQQDGTLALAYAPDGEFIAILMSDAGTWKPHKVFA
jgi:tRNA pseudouridine55 synthase